MMMEFSGSGMLGMMDQGMMRMLMGGPGGMGKMMWQMGAGMKGVSAHPAAWLVCLRA